MWISSSCPAIGTGLDVILVSRITQVWVDLSDVGNVFRFSWPTNVASYGSREGNEGGGEGGGRGCGVCTCVLVRFVYIWGQCGRRGSGGDFWKWIKGANLVLDESRNSVDEVRGDASLVSLPFPDGSLMLRDWRLIWRYDAWIIMRRGWDWFVVRRGLREIAIGKLY